jgi:hypothetical protein
MVLTAYFRALPGESGFLATVIGRGSFCQLDSSVEESGPHGFAVRDSAFVFCAIASIASRAQRFVTIAKRPS